MSEELKDIDVKTLVENPFKLIGDDWMLVTAGDKDSFNTMTASWGNLGVIWNKNIATCLVRPSRHTFQFMEKHERFTLSFFAEEHREMLNYCGTHSGRDHDKCADTGITPLAENDAVWFKEARLVLVCRKIYTDTLKPENFISHQIGEFYKDGDYHTLYFGEVERCLIR